MEFIDQAISETGGIVSQRKTGAAAHGEATNDAPPENRTGLPNSLKTGVESLSGLAMDDVRVHFNSSKPAQLQALAYTQGIDIHVGPGQERHLPHEAWHVVQQKQGRVQPTTQRKGTKINTSATLEKEADTMGAKAESQTRQTVQRKTRPVKSDVVQGKFGFEVELGLALGWSDTDDKAQDKSKYSAPDGHITMPVAATGNGFEVHLDHDNAVKVVEGSTAIVELVTKPPIDESATNEQNVRDRIKQMTDFVTDASSKTNALAERAKLGEIAGITATSQKDGFLFVGGSEKGAQQLDTGYMQATYAIKIEKIPEMFAQIAKPENTINPNVRIIADSVNKTFTDNATYTDFIQTLKLVDEAWDLEGLDDIDDSIFIYKSKWDESITVKEDDREARLKTELAQLMGFFSLIVNYLLIGKFIPKHQTNILRKNHLGLLYYKSRLSTLRNSLSPFSDWVLKNFRNPTIKWLVKYGRRDTLQEDVQKKAGEAIGWETIGLGKWLLNIIQGKSDAIFDNSKNPYSDEIAPYNVGKTNEQTIGTVVESRKVAPKGGYTYKPTNVVEDKYKELANGVDQSERKMTEWADIAVDLWKYLRNINDVE